MASALLPSVSSVAKCQVLMEHFDNPDQLQDAINCSEECAALLQYPSTTPVSKYCPDHPRRKLDVFCRQCGTELCRDCVSHGHSTHQRTSITSVTDEETRRLGEAMGHMTDLLEETKRAVSVVKEMRQRVRSRKEHNMERTREVFNALRKIIDEREEQVITDITKGADKRENTLKLQLERLLLLWTQLQNCLELLKKTRENKVTTTELVRRRKILERRQDHLMLMKKRSRLEPVMKEQREVEYEEVERLCEEVTKLGGFLPLDPSKCEMTFPTAMTIMTKETSLMVTLRDVNGDIVDDKNSEVNVSVTTKTGEAIVVGPVKDVSGGNYTVSFTPRTPGDHIISIVIDGQHIPGSPHKISVVLRDYSKMREGHCQVITHYGGNKFGKVHDVAIGVNNEVIVGDDTNKCVIVLDCNFALLAVIRQGSGDNRLGYANGVAVSKDDIIAISDCSSHQVKKYSLQGKLLSIIGNNRGNNTGQFSAPRGLVFSSNKMLYVVDGWNHRVQVFQQDDKFAFTFGSKGSNPGQFQNPVRIAIDTDNRVLVSDFDGNHISLFSHTGSFISRITCDRPRAITVSPDGHIIASYGDRNKIGVWSPTHQMIEHFGKKGPQQREFDTINGIAMNSSGSIYVVEFHNKRLQVIS
ncbi:tripartite motif-containing protein 2-like [Dysidea avara]|uniref:tripartite motif-containing protein 2-like n=1 Tax=Dysidea avara TaxID=196820 RepID=UPI00331EEF99